MKEDKVETKTEKTKSEKLGESVGQKVLPLRGKTLNDVVTDMLSRRRTEDTKWSREPAKQQDYVGSDILKSGTRCAAAAAVATKDRGGVMVLWGTDMPGVRMTTRNAMTVRKWLNGQIH